MPEPSLASSSTSPPSFVLQERDGRKLSLERALIEPSTGLNQQVLDSEQPQARKSIAKNLAARYSRRFALQYPKAYSWTKRAILYVRGPQPKEDLLPITPLLEREYRFRGHYISLSLESVLIKFTRLATSPWLFAVLAAVYIIGLSFFSRAQSFLTPAESFVGCTSTYWLSRDGCGLDGVFCGPFEDNDPFDFRCPAQCDNVILQNPRTVGDEQTAFVPLIVGGGDANHTYRGDSFICAAAIQAGVIPRSTGGCGRLQLIGNFTDYLPIIQNGLSSIGFPSIFPSSFRFLPGTSLTHCNDLRDGALAFNVLITCALFLLLRLRPLVLFWSLVCIGFWHVVLFSQPMGPPPKIDVAFGTFLPALFIAYGFWRLAFRFVLPEFVSKAPIESCFLYLSGYWVGILYNLTIDKIPISRLLASDIHKRPGGITAFIVIIIVVTILVVNQIRVIRKTGWFPYYAMWYIFGGLVILVIALLPGLQLRLHHYIIPMAILPGTAWPTRLSAIYQGLFLGMFLNGGAAFGFDPILQTPSDLRQDAPMGSLLPFFLTNSTNFNASIPLHNQTIFWDTLPDGWDGFSLLVDDVQRYSGTALNFSLAALQEGLPHFFRLAFTSDGQSFDFTMAATLWPNGTWVDPLPGPS